MSDAKQFRLPDVGEGLTEAEIVSWKVKPGDIVRVNEIVVEIETAKSLVELPSPYAGVVSELLVQEGTTVDVGTPIITVDTVDTGDTGDTGDMGDTGDGSTSPAQAAPSSNIEPPASAVGTPPDEGFVEPGLIGGAAPGGRTSVLVGYGPRTTTAARRPRKSPGRSGTAGTAGTAGSTPSAASAATAQQAVQTSMMTTPTPLREPTLEETPHAAPAQAATAGPDASAAKVLAKPPVRRLARDLGVDLSTVTPSGQGGLVTRADVESVASGGTGTVSSGQRETRIPVKGVRKMTAQAMVASAFTAPHVTEWVTVDVTRTMRTVEVLKQDRDFQQVKVSPLLLVAKALLLAVRRNPGVNASWDEAAQEIVLKHYVNLGIAAATPRGLVVPNIKDADRMSLRELAEAMQSLTATAREGRTQPADMAGGTMTITNVGVFGVDAGTPILNPGESVILCFGAVRDMPWVHEGQVAVRKVTQLALSFDHRIVDGQLGSMFLADVARVLEDPATALLW